MPPVTDFAVKEKYSYLYGFGNYHESEVFQGAIPLVNNVPQKPAYGLRAERISGTSFTAPRERNLQTFMYRTQATIIRGKSGSLGDAPSIPTSISPDSYVWATFKGDDEADWTKQKLLGRNGDPLSKTGSALWIFNIAKDMPAETTFSSLDGEALIILQAGTLDIQTELGKLLVRQNEIAVIPRGIRYRVALPAGPARGYVCELFQGHYKLPDLGVVGSTGLANIRDFQIPKAYFEGKLQNGIASANDEGEWTSVSRFGGRLWSSKQAHTPFDVAAWHGTYYPYKYDLARFCVMGNLSFDIHDPSLFVVLTAPTPGVPGHGVVDFITVPIRYMVSQDSLWVPYWHRNTMSEFVGSIITAQDPKHPLSNLSKNNEFAPFGCALHGPLTAHGPPEEEYQQNVKQDLTPRRVGDEGVGLFVLETNLPLSISDWADELAVKNYGGEGKGPF